MPTATNPVVHVVDDDARALRAIGRLLVAHDYKVQTYNTPQEFLARERDNSIACLVLDLNMPEMNGIDVQRVLASGNENLPIVFISGAGDISTSVRAMKSGAIDFLTKPFDQRDLIAAIEVALQRAREASGEREVLRNDLRLFTRLSPRERQVCLRVAEGLLNKQIGVEFGTTEKTIKAQRGQVMRKLGVNSVPEMVKLVERLRGARQLPAEPVTAGSARPALSN